MIVQGAFLGVGVSIVEPIGSVGLGAVVRANLRRNSMAFKITEAEAREFAQLGATAGCDVGAGFDWG